MLAASSTRAEQTMASGFKDLDLGELGGKVDIALGKGLRVTICSFSASRPS